MPTQLELHAFYNGGAYNAPRHLPRDVTRIVRSLRTMLQCHAPSAKTILDYGAGQGVVGVGLTLSGLEVVGFEIAAAERRTAERLGLEIVADLSLLRGRRFDAILFRHVLEHMLDPRAAVQSAVEQVLAPHGRVFVAIPNFASIAARVLGSGWEWFTPPSHLWYFTPRGLARMVTGCGLRIEAQFACRGDATPLPIQAILGPWRALRRHRSAETHEWPPAPRTDTLRRKTSRRVYSNLASISRLVWPWGDDEAWVVASRAERGALSA